MLSLGQNPLAFRKIAGWQPYLIVRLVMVSVRCTWCMYTKASSSWSGSTVAWVVWSPESRRLCRVRLALGPVSARSNASRFFACTYACRSSFVPAPISGVDGDDGPHAEGVVDDLEAFLIKGSGRDGFLACVRIPPFETGRAISLPKTDDARLCSDDHEASRKSTPARDEQESANPNRFFHRHD